MIVRAPLHICGETCLQAEFDIPDSVSGMSIGIDPKGAFAYSLAVLFDAGGALRYNKWLRSGEGLSLGLDPSHTGLGGMPGPVHPGRWTLRLFTPGFVDLELLSQREEGLPDITVHGGETAPDEPLQGETMVFGDCIGNAEGAGSGAIESVKISSEQADWYKGDFHAHTRLSDGKESVASAVEKARRLNLDFYTATDHNTIHTAWPDAPPFMLPGMEITSKRGHFNIIGLRGLPSDFFEPECMDEGFVVPERMQAILSESAKSGAVNSMNHPFLCEWKWDLPEMPLALFHTVEIICDPTYPFSREANERALALWTRLWNRGNRIYGLGGSDSHNLEHERYDGASSPSIPGDPASWVYCGPLARDGLVCGVKSGHVWVCRGGVKLHPKFLTEGTSFMPGDRIRGKNENDVSSLSCSLSADGVIEGLRAQWVVNGEVLEEIPLREKDFLFRIDIDESRYTWVRIDIRDADGALYGFVNPVWWGKRPDGFRTFAQASNGISGVTR
ncbi:MAG: CehA/McbA family metallohydrolase [Clostridiales Family XIII bacterium]|jgi:hypothetical protein|nr:CehA/McbA family metallohydrolase [Clostridiales Family XIII bacterium]